MLGQQWVKGNDFGTNYEMSKDVKYIKKLLAWPKSKPIVHIIRADFSTVTKLPDKSIDPKRHTYEAWDILGYSVVTSDPSCSKP